MTILVKSLRALVEWRTKSRPIGFTAAFLLPVIDDEAVSLTSRTVTLETGPGGTTPTARER